MVKFKFKFDKQTKVPVHCVSNMVLYFNKYSTCVGNYFILSLIFTLRWSICIHYFLLILLDNTTLMSTVIELAGCIQEIWLLVVHVAWVLLPGMVSFTVAPVTPYQKWCQCIHHTQTDHCMFFLCFRLDDEGGENAHLQSSNSYWSAKCH